MSETHPEPFGTPTLRATLLKVTDGDTLRLNVSLAFGLSYTGNFRVLGIDTPELFSRPSYPGERDDARLAKAFVERLLPVGSHLMIRTHKDTQTFGRYLAEVYVCTGPGAWIALADLLRAAGFDRTPAAPTTTEGVAA